jgi:serine phosphatase RsbU (regulator of sigma subunit)/CHASE3 domain sensor protein
MAYGRRVRSLRARVLILLGIVLLALALGARVVTSAMGALQDATDLVDDSIIPLQLDSKELRSAALNQETGLQGYVLGRADALLLPYELGGAAAERRLASMSALAEGTDWDSVAGVEGPQVSRGIAAVDTSLAAWRTGAAEPQIATVQAGGTVSEADLAAGSRAFLAVRASVDALDAATDVAFDAAQAERAAALALLQRALAVAAVVLVVAVGLLAWLPRRWILGPIRRLSAQMSGVAAGELERPLTPSGPTEIREMGGNAERMRARLLQDVDEAVRAREAIAQQSPLVSIMRAELDHRVPPTAPGWEVAGSVVPAEGALAGDWWDVLRRPDGSSVLVVADLSGHGVQAGLGALRLRDLLGAVLSRGEPLTDALALAAGRFAGESLATVLLVELPAVGEQVRWVNAGHPAAWLCAPDGSATALAPTGPLLSGLGGRWTHRATAFPDGGVLVCPTDGATEARGASGAELGSEGVRALTAAAAAEPAPSAERLERLQSAIRTHTGSRSPDDVTLVVVQRP